jgi:hypothetical protein
MSDDPRWHGWATPEQVMEMIKEMVEFIKNNSPEDYKYLCQFMTSIAPNAES